MKIFVFSKPTTNRHTSFMHTNVSITLFLLTFLLTISINCINCTPSITTLPPKKKKNSISEKIVSIYDSIEIPASNSLLRTNLGGGKVRNSSRKRSVDVRHFEADWAIFSFFLNREHDDFTLAHPPPSINPANCSPYKFFSHPSFRSSRARTYNAHDPPFPFTCSTPQPFEKLPLLSSPLHAEKKSTRPGFQTADLFFHVAIYFFTPACTGWMRKESSKGEPTTTCLSHPYFSLSSFLSLLLFLLFFFIFLFFIPSFLEFHSNGRVSFPSKPNDEWLLE